MSQADINLFRLIVSNLGELKYVLSQASVE